MFQFLVYKRKQLEMYYNITRLYIQVQPIFFYIIYTICLYSRRIKYARLLQNFILMELLLCYSICTFQFRKLTKNTFKRTHSSQTRVQTLRYMQTQTILYNMKAVHIVIPCDTINFGSQFYEHQNIMRN